MKSRILSLALALLMVSLLPVAGLASSPSVSGPAMYSAVPTVPFVIEVVPETETALKVLDEIRLAVQGDQPIVASYFADEAEAIAEVAEADMDVDALKLYELASLRVSGYVSTMGNVQAILRFPVRFEANKANVVMIGLVSSNDITWEALAGNANADGNVVVELESDLLLKVQTGDAVIAILQ